MPYGFDMRRRSGPLPVSGPFKSSARLLASLTESFKPGDQVIISAPVIDPFKDKQLDKGSCVTVVRPSGTGHLICLDSEGTEWAVPTKHASFTEKQPSSGLHGRYRILMGDDEKNSDD